MEVLATGQDEIWTREIKDPSTKSRIKITADDVKYDHKGAAYYVMHNGHKVCLMEHDNIIVIDVPKHVREDAESRYWEARRSEKRKNDQESMKKADLEKAAIKNLFFYTPIRVLILFAAVVFILWYVLK